MASVVTFPSVAEEQPTVTDIVMEDVQAVGVVMKTKLTKCPKTLHDTWKECDVGFRGFKPAKDWTAAERRRYTYKYQAWFTMTLQRYINPGEIHLCFEHCHPLLLHHFST